MSRLTCALAALVLALLSGCVHRPPPIPTARWAQVADDVHLRYQRIGTGPTTVVLLHELGASLESWDEELPALVSQDLTIVRYDARGSGLSTKIRAPLTLQQETDDLLGLLDHLGIRQPVVLVGDTFGGAIALQFAADHPERTAGVLAMDPPIYLTPQPQRVAKFPDPLAPGAAPASLDAAHGGREREFAAVYPVALRTDPHRYDRFTGVAYSTDPTSAMLMLRMIYSVGFADVLARIGCPVILTAGTLFLRPVAEVRELAAAIPHGRVVALRSGHYAAQESPELVVPLVQSFLTQLQLPHRSSPHPAALGATPQWRTVNHVSLRYQLSGNGPNTVVLLQESGMPLEIWDEILPTLSSAKRTILRYDPRGAGLSQKFRTPVTMADEVEDLQSLLDTLQLHRPVTLIGGALGGSIALSFAAAHPDTVRAIAITSPSALLVAKAPRPWINPATDPAGARAAQLRTLDVIYPPALRTDADRFRRFLGMADSGDPDSDMLTEKLINTTPFADVLPTIRCPTLLIATSLFVRPVDSVRELAQTLPQGRFMVLKTGHLASWQSPQLVASVLLRFLHEVGG